MRTLPRSLFLILLAVLTGSALAATQNLLVSAQVVGTCRFDSAADIDFGTLDRPRLLMKRNGRLVFWCTKNADYTLGDETNPAVADGKFSGTLVGTNGHDPLRPGVYQLIRTGRGKTSPITSVVTAPSSMPTTSTWGSIPTPTRHFHRNPLNEDGNR